MHLRTKMLCIKLLPVLNNNRVGSLFIDINLFKKWLSLDEKKNNGHINKLKLNPSNNKYRF